MLAARQRLIIFYTGQNIRDGTHLPPSVVVGELLESLLGDELEGDAGGASLEERVMARFPNLLVRHPLQPFSSRYFSR